MSATKGRTSHARRLIRWVLELDRPIPARTDQEIEALVEHNYRWNFGANLADGASFWLGMSFVSSTTIIPLFVSKLTPSTLAIGLVAMLAQGGWFLPQIFTANWVERLPRRKPVLVSGGLLLERLPVWIFVLAAVLANWWATLALAVFLVAYTWNRLGSGTVATSWQDLIARVIPLKKRGRFWGLTSAIGTGLGFAGAVLSAWVLSTYPFPTSFVFLFGLAAAILTIGWLFLWLIREPALPPNATRQSQRQFLGRLPQLLRQDRPFRHFLVARVLLALANMGLGFIAVAAVRQWGVSDGTVGLYTGILLLGQAAGNLIFGLLADGFGHKLSLEWAAGAYTIAFTVAWLAPSASWYYVVFFLLGVGQGILVVSGILVVLEFCGPQRRPTYVGMANTAVGLASITGPLLGAWLAARGYGLLFALSAAISLAALMLFHWWVQDPRKATIEKPTYQAADPPRI